MTILLIVFAWFTAIGIYLPINAYLAAGRGRGDRAANAAVLAQLATESTVMEGQHLPRAA